MSVVFTWLTSLHLYYSGHFIVHDYLFHCFIHLGPHVSGVFGCCVSNMNTWHPTLSGEHFCMFTLDSGFYKIILYRSLKGPQYLTRFSHDVGSYSCSIRLSCMVMDALCSRTGSFGV